jgi:hypothetical protein
MTRYEFIEATHAPLVHACDSLQTVPHAPQLLASVSRATSQPSAALPLQSRWFASHVYPQVPLPHVVVAPARAGHTIPQPPQLLTSDNALTSHPSAALPLQFLNVPVHVKPQAPPVQSVVAFARAGQTVPQALQLATLVAVSISQPSAAVPLQSRKAPVQVKPHDEPEQAGVLFARDGQALPHPPQFAGSLALLTSHPSVARTLQSWKAPLQLNPQVPDTQVVVALVRAGQALPQAPQLELSVAEYTSQPFTVFASQLRKAPVQLIPQAPPAHVGLELARVGHTVPQAPQFERFVAPSISHPSAPTVLQSR